MTPRRFQIAAGRADIALDARTQMLYDTRCIYINGIVEAMSAKEKPALHALADRRTLRGEAAEEVLPRLYAWYRAGFLHLQYG